MQQYYQPYQQSYQPYPQYQYQPQMDRLNQLQQFQQNLQPQQQNIGILGKVIDSIDVVKATDIPMDGNIYYFPKADGTEIYIKRWNSNGTTSITTYKPVLDDLGEQVVKVSTNDIKDQIGALQTFTDDIMKHIDERFDKIEKNFANAKKNFRTQKENEE